MLSVTRSPMVALLAFGIIASLLPSALAHTYLSGVVLGGNKLNEGDCVRPHRARFYENPIPMVSSPEMTCGWLPEAAQRANRKCPIAAGSTIGVQWWHNYPNDDILEATHKGPVMFYLAKSEDGQGPVWFKIYEDGYTHSNQQWGTDRLIANRGIVNVKIPADIAPGNYLMRGEILALHNAYDVNGVQPYVGCIELTISGSGSATPTGVAFPGAYSTSEPGIRFDVYHYYSSYSIPGPAVYKGTIPVPPTAAPSVRPTDAPTAAPTAAPTTAPTVAPTAAPATPAPTPVPSTPSVAPTSRPTYAPTSAPTVAPTTAPTVAPTSSPSTGNQIQLMMNQGSSAWWLAVTVAGGLESTSKVEIKDSGAVDSWTALSDMSWAYIFDRSIQLTLPISVRLTAASGKQVTLDNIFTSWSSNLIPTGMDYGSATTTPTSAPTTPPTTAPTDAPTDAPTTPTTAPTTTPGPLASVTVFSSSSSWWVALTVSGVPASDVARVEFKDSGVLSSYVPMDDSTWAYTLTSTSGSPFVAPVTIRITNKAGKSVTATLDAITPDAVFQANGSL